LERIVIDKYYMILESIDQ
jgi:superfamily II DNA helicase RecQ